MEYSGKIIMGIFMSRPNRFIAKVMIEGKEEICHVKNTGRCRELLIPGVRVYLEESRNPARKTKYSLIAVYKGEELINLDSQAPNGAAFEWVASGGLIPDIQSLKREVSYGNSRLDLFASAGERKIFIEVKGVTLERDGIAYFPDAPTVRGVKHVYELCEAVKEGYEAYILFVIQMKHISSFKPNDQTHREFGDALRFAAENGVHICAVDCDVTPGTILIRSFVNVDLSLT